MFVKIKNSKELVEFIEKEIKTRKLRVNDVCLGIGMSRSQFWRFRTGDSSSVFNFDDYMRMCEYFGVENVLLKEE